MRILFINTIVCLFLAAAPAVMSQEIWGALVLGTQQEDPPPVPDCLQPYHKMLDCVFGYNRLDVMGEASHRLIGEEETWIIPSKEFFLRVIGKNPKKDKYVLNVQLFHCDKLLVETDTKMMRGKPLIIRGPLWGQGQLFFLLVVK